MQRIGFIIIFICLFVWSDDCKYFKLDTFSGCARCINMKIASRFEELAGCKKDILGPTLNFYTQYLPLFEEGFTMPTNELNPIYLRVCRVSIAFLLDNYKSSKTMAKAFKCDRQKLKDLIKDGILNTCANVGIWTWAPYLCWR